MTGNEQPNEAPAAVRTAPLIISHEMAAQLRHLVKLGAARPVEISTLAARLGTPRGKRLHLTQMAHQSVRIPGQPWPWIVTYSLEVGHPVGTCRHMSMSVVRDGRAPSLEAVEMVAELLGFVGGAIQSRTWVETLSDGRVALNLAQPVAWTGPGGTA